MAMRPYGSPIPGPSLRQAQDAVTKTPRVLCYIDSASVTVNPQVANGNAGGHVLSCPPANPKFCGDGFPGAGPPGCSQAGQSPTITCKSLANQGAGCPSLPCDASQ